MCGFIEGKRKGCSILVCQRREERSFLAQMERAGLLDFYALRREERSCLALMEWAGLHEELFLFVRRESGRRDVSYLHIAGLGGEVHGMR